MVKLSLCMATLNREVFIRQTLDSILSQLSADTELVVLDGGSTDGTEQVVRSLFEGRVNCHYHRISVKGGIDRDFCRSISHASGEFCWLLADDDLIKPGAIKRVVSELRDDRDLVLVNSEVADRELKRILVTKRLRIQNDVLIKARNQSELLATAGDLLSFIGTVVIRRTVWLARDEEPYIGTEFIHVGIIFQSPLHGDCLIIAEPLIRIRYGNAQWSRRAFEIWMFKWPSLIWSFQGVSTFAMACVVPKQPYKHIVSLLLMKARGCYSAREYHERLADLKLGFVARLCAATIAFFPDKVFNLLAVVVLKAMRLFPSVLVDLECSPFYIGRRG
jgi:abequosyltransferase